MSLETTSDLSGFHEFIGQQLQSGEPPLSPEQALAMWRERQETIASVRRGLADVEAGRTSPATEVLAALRRAAKSS
jgi:predicted transcriptional regulator